MNKKEKKNLSVIITVILIFISAIISVSYISGTENKVKNNARITIGQAREIALEDAETNEDSIVFTKQKRELEKGIYAYEIEFTDVLT